MGNKMRNVNTLRTMEDTECAEGKIKQNTNYYIYISYSHVKITQILIKIGSENE